MSKVTIKGQVTIPNNVRQRLGIKPGDEIEFVQNDDDIVLRKKFNKSPFDKYVGHLKDGRSSNEIIDEIRGEK